MSFSLPRFMLKIKGAALASLGLEAKVTISLDLWMVDNLNIPARALPLRT